MQCHLFSDSLDVIVMLSHSADAGEQCGKEHGGPCSLEKTIIALSASLSQSFQGTSRWSATDTSAGLLKLYNRHMQEKATDNLIGIKVVNP